MQQQQFRQPSSDNTTYTAVVRFAKQDRVGTGQGGPDLMPFAKAGLSLILSVLLFVVPIHNHWQILPMTLMAALGR